MINKLLNNNRNELLFNNCYNLNESICKYTQDITNKWSKGKILKKSLVIFTINTLNKQRTILLTIPVENKYFSIYDGDTKIKVDIYSSNWNYFDNSSKYVASFKLTFEPSSYK